MPGIEGIELAGVEVPPLLLMGDKPGGVDMAPAGGVPAPTTGEEDCDEEPVAGNPGDEEIALL